jgi:small GTP-binding protein
MRIVQKKICVLGDFAVGKTSLIRRYVEGLFDDKYLTTVGVVISRKVMAHPDYALHLLIWDLAGGRDFSHSRYLLGTAGALLVCDLTRAETLSAYEDYAGQVRRVNAQVPLFLLANKADLDEQRVISDELLAACSRDLGAPFLLTSAKTGDNVEAAFTRLAEMLAPAE